LRSKFPEKVDSSTLQSYGLAKNNESYIINTLRFLGLIDKDGARIESAHEAFLKGDDEFVTSFAKLVQVSYKGLFDLRGDSAWELDKPKLTTFFRTQDKSTELVGSRQADTFIRLAELAGKRPAGNEPEGRTTKPSRGTTKPPTKKPKTPRVPQGPKEEVNEGGSEERKKLPVSLSVRIEVNLPATTDQSVYDAIFRSIRENFVEGA
jgi:hypothetical protein